MNYIEAVNVLKSIERHYNVMSVKYKGVSVWPYLRCYLIDQLGYQKARKPTVSNFLFIIKNLFCYNPLIIRKKIDIWSYSGVITRKKLGSLYHHHASGVLPFTEYSVLNWENPEISRPHFLKKEIPEKFIISNSWSIFLSRGFEFLFRLSKLKIDNYEILEEINKEFNVNFDYKFRIRLLYAQKISTDLLLLLAKKPRLVVMECPYDQMGYVWSFHNHNISVIEFQHGVINSNHYAYNSYYNAGILAPDALCLYGEEEYKYITNRKVPFCPIVKQTGLFILDEANKFFKEDVFQEERKIFKTIIVIAGQSDCEEQLLNFIEDVALITPKIFYAYIPRRVCNITSNLTNVQILFNVNIYQYLKWCDIHCTVSSTTCLESQYFQKPNIFVELNDTAKIYYGHILSEDNGSFFVKDKTTFTDVIEFIRSKKTFKYRELFTKGNIQLTNDVLSIFINS